MREKIIDKLKLKASDFEYRLKGYRKLKSFKKNNDDTLTYKILQVHSYIETQNNSNIFYSFIYSLALISLLVSLV